MACGNAGGRVVDEASQFSASQLRTTCLSNESLRSPRSQAARDQKRLESGVSTSSPSVISPVCGSRPNSNLVSAKINPAFSANSAALAKICSDRSRSALASASPTSSTTRSKVMFSSWSPSSALNAGVKIGSGSLAPKVSPSGSATPQMVPSAWYSFQPEPEM